MKIAYSDANGKVWILHPAPDANEKLVLASIPKDAKEWVRLPGDFIYPDRTLAHLWRIENGTVVVGKP